MNFKLLQYDDDDDDNCLQIASQEFFDRLSIMTIDLSNQYHFRRFLFTLIHTQGIYFVYLT